MPIKEACRYVEGTSCVQLATVLVEKAEKKGREVKIILKRKYEYLRYRDNPITEPKKEPKFNNFFLIFRIEKEFPNCCIC